jgi:hypothetical protein
VSPRICFFQMTLVPSIFWALLPHSGSGTNSGMSSVVYGAGQEVTVEEHIFQDGNRGLVAVGRAAHARLDLTPEETNIVQNALNEICNGINLGDEFETRIGATVGEARALLEHVAGLRRQ